MMVTFVSQCEKKALLKTRRVLDSFANRIGDNTWQTIITNDGLNAVKKLLRRTATKNTAVACHWLRSRSRSELVWIIGNRNKFNAEGIIPVHFTRKDIINTRWENDWHYLPLIKCLAALASLFHDFGKASWYFQEKLLPESKNKFKGDPLRHEWVSVLLFHAFVNNKEKTADPQWLARLARGDIDELALTHTIPDKPLTGLPHDAGLLAWLIVSHHKLPVDHNDDFRADVSDSLDKVLSRISQKWGYENRYDEAFFTKGLKHCLTFPKGLPSQSKPWLQQVRKWATKMQACLPLLEQAMQDGSWRLVLHHARLSLMLGDHHYSSQDADKKWHSDMDLIANTYRDGRNGHRKGEAKQKLDEHLVGVAHAALDIAHLLPAFESEVPYIQDIHSLKKKSPPAFSWQDKAVEKIKNWKQTIPAAYQGKHHGLFAVNMASTGCGKTYANAKVMRALSHDGESLRFILALGLRTLTLQTGDEYRERIGLDNSDLAIIIGSKAVMELHQYNKLEKELEPENRDEAAGSESLESLLDDNEIDYECAIPETRLNTVLNDERKRKFFYAPVLVCTIDHMMPATECVRGGRYILPNLRLMSSDLVIDEIDDFNGSDLVAIGRLIHLAGMLGRKVMISSATIPPDLAQGYFNAYREGWLLFAKTRAVSTNIGCAWIDEFGTQVETLSHSDAPQALTNYEYYHDLFVDKRVKKLKAQPIRRMAEIISCEHIKNGNTATMSDENKLSIEQAYFDLIQQAIVKKHQQHAEMEPKTAKMVSFGVVRMANINPCVALTEFLAAEWPEGIDFRVMPYHSQQVLLLRSAQEKHLDEVLKRNNPLTIFENHVIRQHLHNSKAKHMIFILVATPVEEVGRDHDLDWAIAEPSSFRSIIQLAGRVLRHRDKTPQAPNIAIMQYNLKALTQSDDQPAYCRPGYETKDDDVLSMLSTHDINQLIEPALLADGINAIPRIQRNKMLNPRGNFADLEHYSISKLLTAYKIKSIGEPAGPEKMQGWLTQYWWLTAYPQKYNPFRKSTLTVTLFLEVDDGTLQFMQKSETDSSWHERGANYGIKEKKPEESLLTRFWLNNDYQQLIETQADKRGITELHASHRYGELSWPIYDENKILKYYYSHQLGLYKLR